ncbi:MAG: glycosyltransferase [Candidatus Obscuribacterales bacterium]|nr:glycosyltransferase [Candidatus Obscuribacterales bacterium]
MKRVLLTVHKFFPEHKAGTEVLTLKVAQELQHRGYEVQVLTADPPDTDARHAVGPTSQDYEFQGVKVHSLGESLRLQGYTFEHEFVHPAIGLHAEELIKTFRPDLMHVFHAQNLSASILDAASRQNVPTVFSATDFWFVCPIVQLKLPDGSVCRGPGPGGRKCLTCYTPHLIPPKPELLDAVGARFPIAAKALDMAGPLKGVAGDILHAGYSRAKWPAASAATLKRPEVLREAANSFKAIMVPTRLMRDIFVENGINEKLISLVPFGIDTAPLEIHRCKEPSTTLRIGFIGTLFEHKGPDLLIDAFNALPTNADAILKIYGNPEQFPEFGQKLLKQAASGANAAKIEFCGTFANEKLGAVLQQLDVLVVPSRWYENTPLVIQSALATATPLVATNLGGMAELIHHEVNGLLFELNSVNSLREQLHRLLTDRSLLLQLRDNIKPERTVPQMVDDIEAVYNNVLGTNNCSDAGDCVPHMTAR